MNYSSLIKAITGATHRLQAQVVTVASRKANVFPVLGRKTLGRQSF